MHADLPDLGCCVSVLLYVSCHDCAMRECYLQLPCLLILTHVVVCAGYAAL
jgi:hypothetical protein